MKSIKATFYSFKFLSVYIISLYRKLELFAMNKLGKTWFHSTFLVKFHECWVRSLKSVKQLFWNKFCITACNVWAWKDNFKYQILTLQSQKVADEKYKFFPTIFICKIKLQLKSYLSLLRKKSYALPHDDLRAVSSAQIIILQRTSSGRKLM